MEQHAISSLWLTGIIVISLFFTGNVETKFILDSNTGRLALPNPLDYERDSNVYYIRIRAREVGITPYQSSEVNVQILLVDLNDNAPEFSHQRYRYSH